MRMRWIAVAGVMLTVGFGSLAMAQADAPAAAPDEAAVTPEAAPAPGGTDKLTLLQLLMKGGPLMYPLGLCSIVMVAFVIERALGLRRFKVLPDDTLSRVNQAMRSVPTMLDAEALLRDMEPRRDPLARVVLAGLRRANRTLPEIEKAIEDAGAREASTLRRNCRVLSMIASVAPLLGLLGTVTGMMRSFMTVAAKAEALGRTELLAAGIYEALVTTAVGLAIAIPALVFYYLYVEKVESFVSEIDSIAEELVVRIPARH
ncbi:MAG: MotA/TolQ/ExbB proton channel family protein [Lentisphaerae bacterium]|nr:MotA/TolQ/ExbB proton channel family protein [Lentisphaerota bacterium]